MSAQGFDPAALDALERAALEARRCGHRVVGLPHLLLALAEPDDGVAAKALDQVGVDRRSLRAALRRHLAPPRTAFPGMPAPSARLQRVLQAAHQRSASVGRTVDERTLLALLLSFADGAAAEALEELGLDGPGLATQVAGGVAAPAAAVAPRAAQPAGKVPATKTLDELGRDITALAREGKLSPVFGRNEEVRRVARTLLRRTKSNPLLLGEAGVGKTAIVEALAQRIAGGNVRPELREVRIIEVPVSALVAGTKYRGEFEQRLRALVAEARADPRIVLFFDEVHTLLGAGAAEGAPLDAANILKPALARGELRCIGATTTEEYRKHIEADAALARRFQPITVAEPAPGEALAILRQLAPRFAEHHGIAIDDSALDAAVRLAVAHLPERRLPDKAIDLLDEACARVRLRTLRPTAASPGAVTADDVAAALADWTGIEAGRLLADERDQLKSLETLLAERVVGQPEAVAAVARQLRLARTGLKDPRRPVGVLLFLGPTGVGKTEMARATAEVLYGDPERLTRLDMSEYGEAHTVARLVGAPPGYVGHDAPGLLSEALQRQPQSVVLFDEIEKAHTQVLDLFLQLFDAGRLTDARGHVVDGREALFIMTSNLGTTGIAPPRPIGFLREREGPSEPLAGAYSNTTLLRAALLEALRPEFINRVDAIVAFRALGLPELEHIAQRFLDELAQRAAAQGVSVEVTPAAVALLAQLGLDPAFGARPLRRAVEQLVAEPLAQLLLQDDPPTEVRVTVDADSGGVLVVGPADRPQVEDSATADRSPGREGASGGLT